MQRLPSDKVELLQLREFVTPDLAARLIELIEQDRRPSTLADAGDDRYFRTSETCDLDAAEPAVRSLEEQLFALNGIDPAHGEPLQGQRYRVGEEYRHHRDHFRIDKPHWHVERRRGGQRTWTAMVYLNAVEEGGETDFPELDLKIVPEPGLLVLWDNMDRQGMPNPATRHAALPVLAGRKHVVTQWYRQGEWSMQQRG